MNETRLAEAARVLRGGPAASPDPVRGAALFRALADEGDGVALLRCAVLAAGGIGQPRNWPLAIDLLKRAAVAGAEDAAAQLELLAGTNGVVDLEHLTTPPELERLHSEAMVGVVRGFAPPAFCSWIIAHGRDKLVPSTVANVATGAYEVNQARTATTCIFGPLKRDLVIAVMQERAMRVSGAPISNHEPPNLISYEPGQRYGAHFDFLPPHQPGMQAELATNGQRVMTMITYLNDEFEGAATRFPTLELEFRGGVGDALFFSNVLADGSPDRRTLHAGLPPVMGRKWVLSQWLRNREQFSR